MSETARYIRPPSAESRGEAPGRGRLRGRKVLVVGGGQRTFDAATDPIGNGRAMSILFAREGARVAVADLNAASAAETVARIATRADTRSRSRPTSRARRTSSAWSARPPRGSAASTAWC